MAHTFIDGGVLEGKEAVPFQAALGLDLVTDKLSVFPGSLQECLNYEVTTESGYTLSKGLLEYGLKDFKVPSFVYTAQVPSLSSENKAKLIVGAELMASVVSSTLPDVDEEAVLKILAFEEGPATEDFIYFRLIRGSLLPTTSDYKYRLELDTDVDLDLINGASYVGAAAWEAVQGIVYDGLALNSFAQRVPGIGPILAITEIDDTIYAAREGFGHTDIALRFDADVGNPVDVSGDTLYLVEFEVGPDVYSFLATFDDIEGVVISGNVYSGYDMQSMAPTVLSPRDMYKLFLNITVNDTDEAKLFTTHKDPATGALTKDTELLGDGRWVDVLSYNRDGAILWKAPDLYNRKEYLRWDLVDMGHEVTFVDGELEPVTGLDLIFVEDPPEPKEKEAGHPSAHEVSAGWSSAHQAYEDTANWAFVDTNPITAAAGVTSLQSSRRCAFSLFDSSTPRNSLIVGVSVKITARKHVDAAAYEIWPAARLSVNGILSPWRHLGSSEGPLDHTTWTEVVLGGGASYWTDAVLSASGIAADDFEVQIAPAAYRTNTSGTTVAEMNVAEIELTLTYQDGTEDVFFYDTDATDDVATGKIVHSFREKGDWDIGSAEGVFTVYDLDAPQNISADLEIRTAANGGGDLIAITSSVPTIPRLPNYDALGLAESVVYTIKSNFYADSRGEAVYGVTGAGPAFMLNEDFFVYIRTGVPAEKERPRHIHNHADHLILGYSSGQILVSVPGSPLDFSGVRGASEWGFGDTIVGFLPLSGSALGVICRNSIQAFVGTSPLSFNKQLISSVSGGLEYTTAGVVAPMFCDENGVTSVETTAAYGDFNLGKVTKRVYPLVQSRFQDNCVCGTLGPKLAVPVRGRNQYKLFFKDGLVLTISMFEGEEGVIPMITTQRYDTGTSRRRFVPTCALSTVLSDGKEIVLLGTVEGKILSVNGSMGVKLEHEHLPMQAHITFNPFNGGLSHLNLKYSEVFLHGTSTLPAELNLSAGVNYFRPETSAYNDAVQFGERDTPVTPGQYTVPSKAAGRLPSLTDGLSLKVSSEGFILPPHNIQAITYRVKGASDKTAAPRSRL